MIAKQRLYLNADKSAVVGEGDRACAFLYAVPGDEIPDEAAARFGLVDGKLPRKGSKGGKASKGSKAAENEVAGNGQPAADDLTSIKGIGKATAKALVQAGVDSFKALAEVDPNAPPVKVSGATDTEWAAWVAAAQAQSGSAPESD
ncbi:helix-hairpin-helix domain-containing protein [Roseibium sp.]|uniref:helix-hairpin-helix domain-containing protein n=1 Tax=Roseibium sp. TaxID=1936156 RepID=UPI00326517E0